MTKRVAKKILGIILILIGLLALLTPLTPGSWLAIIGLEMLGVRLLFWDNMKKRYRNYTNKRDMPTDETLR